MQFPVRLDQRRDFVLFPFPDKDLRGGFALEYARSSTYLEFKRKDKKGKEETVSNCMDADEFIKAKPATFRTGARLVVIAHGSGADGWKNVMKGDSNTVLDPAGLAQLIGGSGFVRGISNEIYIWSCQSGVQGGFASQFAKAMVAHGVSQVNIYGCKINTAPISANRQLMVQGPRPATNNDVVSYWGANLQALA